MARPVPTAPPAIGRSSLASDFRRLEADILARGDRDFAEAHIGEWAERERKLEATEPAALGNLVRICQNELAVAQNQPEKVRPVGAVRHALAHWFDLPMKQRAA